MTDAAGHPHGPTWDRPIYRALCCSCGALRTARSVRRSGHRGEPFLDDAISGSARCVTNLRCVRCARMTVHAYLRPDAQRDYLEGQPAQTYVGAVLADLELRDDLGDS